MTWSVVSYKPDIWQFPEFDRWSCYGIQIRRSLADQSPVHTRGRRICIHPGTAGSGLVQHGAPEEHVQSWSQHVAWSSIGCACALFRHFIRKTRSIMPQSSPVQSSPVQRLYPPVRVGWWVGVVWVGMGIAHTHMHNSFSRVWFMVVREDA